MLYKVIRIFAAVFLLIAVDIIFEVYFPIVKDINIETDKLKKGSELALLQISDFHGSDSGIFVERIIKKAERIKPDAVLLTGDLVDQSTEDYENVYALVKKLHSICPSIFFVSGNHEWNNSGRTMLLGKLKDLDVVLLNNKASTLSTNSENINICGVDDPYTHRDNIEKAMKGADADKYTVLLSHTPRIRDRLGRYTPDLILCGHTHGGQVRLPFVGAVIAPGEGIFPEFDKGTFYLDNNCLLYIDSGVGISKLPIRFLNRSQISLIRIMGMGKTEDTKIH